MYQKRKSKSLSRLEALASIRASLNQLHLHGDLIDDPVPQPQRQPASPRVGDKRVSLISEINLGITSPPSSAKRFEPNTRVERKRQSSANLPKSQKKFIKQLQKHLKQAVEPVKQEIQAPNKPKQVKEQRKQRPKRQLLIPGKMLIGQTAAKVEQSVAISKQKEAKREKKKTQQEQNSWLHTEGPSLNTYKPTMLPFFSNYDGQKKMMKQIKKMKESGADQARIQNFVATMKKESKEEPIKDILLTENGKVDDQELFYFQLPKTLPIQQKELQQLPNGMKLGKLKILKNGKAKMVFQNGLELELHRGIQAAFFQEGAILDHENKQAVMLGGVGNKCVLSPNLIALVNK